MGIAYQRVEVVSAMAGKPTSACAILAETKEMKHVLEGIETGYEAKFDFPYRRDLPDRVYMIATVPRTGSSYLSHMLWQSGCLGAPLEYLNFLPGSPYAMAHRRPDEQAGLWRSALHRRTSTNGVFGVKCFSLQLRELQRDNPSLLLEVFATVFPQGRKASVVRLKRRDEVAHAISYARAALSGVWRKEQEPSGGASVEYSARAVDEARQLLAKQEADWDLLLSEIGVEPLTIWYEDAVERPEEMVASVARFLDVALDPAARIAIPEVEKQAEGPSKLWAERYSDGAP
jgi:LPS sulfotransferase NodH